MTSDFFQPSFVLVVDTGSYWSGFGQGVILALFQLGGFGMMTSATLLGLLVNRQMRLRSRLLLQAETRSLGLGDVKSIAWLILIITVVVELAATLVLTLRFAWGHAMPWGEAAWQGLFHAVSAYNNAGFSTWGDSVMGFAGDAWILGPLMAAIVIGGLGFPVLHELMVERERRHPSMHTVVGIGRADDHRRGQRGHGRRREGHDVFCAAAGGLERDPRPRGCGVSQAAGPSRRAKNRSHRPCCCAWRCAPRCRVRAPARLDR